MKRIFTIVLLAAGVILSAQAQQTKLLTAEKHNEYGLVYSLPLTALQIKVTAKRVSKTPGPYYQYAKKYLGKSNVITENSVTSTVTGVSVAPFGVLDNSKSYLMQLKAGQTTFIGVDADGMLLSINAEPLDPSDIGMRSQTVTSPILISSEGSVEDYLKYVDMDFVSAQSSMKQAEMLANSLMEVRDAYLSLTRGTADNMPTDGRQLELMLNSLEEQQNAITRAFTGSTTIEEYTSEYMYIPEKEGEEVIFRLSNYDGFVDAADYSGAPVYIKTEIVVEGELPKDEVTGEAKKLPKDAVIYALPGSARITVYNDDSQYFDKEIEFSQFGVTFGLDPKLFTDKKSPAFARFSPITGALIEIGKAVEDKAEKTAEKQAEEE